MEVINYLLRGHCTGQDVTASITRAENTGIGKRRSWQQHTLYMKKSRVVLRPMRDEKFLPGPLRAIGGGQLGTRAMRTIASWAERPTDVQLKATPRSSVLFGPLSPDQLKI